MPKGLLRVVGVGFVALLIVGVSAEAPARQRAIERPPNIVLIIGDDHGWPYAGFMGSEIVSTPNLDALAAGGTVFTHVFASGNLCQPSLRTLLSGLDSAAWDAQRDRTNVTFGSELPPAAEVRRFPTLPRLIGREGYVSFEAGKHWEGTALTAGFTAGTATAILPPFTLPSDGFGRPSIEPMAEFLDTAGEAPFFLWLAPSVPHTPLDPSPEFQAPYRAMGLAEPAVLYYANVTRLDALVGEMLGELRARGLDRDTLVVYLSDNGWEQAPDRAHFLGSVLGGDRGKASIYELGARAPTILHWPGQVRAGRRDAGLANFADVNATLLDYAGVRLPADHSGVSLRRRAEGRRKRGRRAVFGASETLRVREDEFVPGAGIVRFDEAAYVRTRRWRYVEFMERGEHELYRIDSDPFEKTDVAEQYPRIVARLADLLGEELGRRAEPAEVVDVTGSVRDIEGGPVSGLSLTLSSSGVGFKVSTGSDGSFRIPNVPARDYVLRVPASLVFQEGRIFGPLPVPLTGLETGPHLELVVFGLKRPRVVVPLGRSEISGKFVDSRGDPVAGLPIVLEALNDEGERESRLRLMTGADGRFWMDQLPQGDYRLAAVRTACTGERFIFLEEASRIRVNQSLACTGDVGLPRPRGRASPFRVPR